MTNTIPFLIGITGHRTVTHPASVKKDIKECLLFWRQKVGNNTPIWILSGVATGFDQLAVNVTEELTMANKAHGEFRIVPILPMPSDFYINDFQEAGLKEYKRIIAQYAHHEVSALTSLSNEELITAYNTKGHGRNLLYLAQGAFLARYCNVLLTYWDGKSSQGIGGTADIIDIALKKNSSLPKEIEQLTPIKNNFDGSFIRVVHHIPTQSTQKNSHSFSNINYIHPHSHLNIYDTEKTNDSNHNLLSEVNGQEIENLTSQLAKLNSPSVVTCENNLPTGLHDLAPAFTHFDNAACSQKKKYYLAIKVLLALSGIGYISFILLGLYLEKDLSRYFMLSTFFFAAATFALGIGLNQIQLKFKFQLARLVAESLRIQGYLNLAGAPLHKESLVPKRFRHSFPILNHIISIAELDQILHGDSTDLELAKSLWIEGQITHLRNSINSFQPTFNLTLTKNKSNQLPTIDIFLLFFVVASFAMLFFSHTYHFIPLWGQSLLLAFIQVLLTIVSLKKLYEKVTHSNVEHYGYTQLLVLYKRAKNDLFKTITPHSTLVKLAEEALLENSEWLLCQTENDYSNQA